MTSIAENNALEWNRETREGFEQNIDPLSANDLPGIDDEIPVAEIAAEIWVAHARNRWMNLDLFGRESVSQQLVFHILSDDDHAIELFVQEYFSLLIGVADQFEWKPFAAISFEESAASEDAKRARGARADFSSKIMIFVAAHAVNVVVVNHPNQRNPGTNQSADDIEVGHFMHVNEVWLENFKSCFDSHGIAFLIEGKAMRKSFFPGGLRTPGGRPVDDADGVSAVSEFFRSDMGVGFRTSHCAETIVYKQKFHGF